MDPAALLDAATRALDAVIQDGRRRDLNETDTRTFVITPILAALGYETLDHLSQEVYLPGAGESVDYILTAGDRRIFVEAKALSVSLGKKEAIQIVRYCSHQPVRWALLTNGVEWHIFDTDVSGDWEAKRVARIDLEAAHRDGLLEDALHPLALFAPDAIPPGCQARRPVLLLRRRRRRRRHRGDHRDRRPGSPAGILARPDRLVVEHLRSTPARHPVATPAHPDHP